MSEQYTNISRFFGDVLKGKLESDLKENWHWPVKP